jgi:hypothetical protein
MTTILAIALAYAGLTCLCVAMDRHHRQVFGRVPAVRTALALRLLGAALLALSVLPSVTSFPGSMGIVAWFGVVTAAGLVLVFTLPYAPRVSAVLAVVGPAAAAILAVSARFAGLQ